MLEIKKIKASIVFSSFFSFLMIFNYFSPALRGQVEKHVHKLAEGQMGAV